MSPLSIAQYLPTDQALFDLVNFDVASQITPWDAIGAMAPGRQVARAFRSTASTGAIVVATRA